MRLCYDVSVEGTTGRCTDATGGYNGYNGTLSSAKGSVTTGDPVVSPSEGITDETNGGRAKRQRG